MGRYFAVAPPTSLGSITGIDPVCGAGFPHGWIDRSDRPDHAFRVTEFIAQGA